MSRTTLSGPPHRAELQDRGICLNPDNERLYLDLDFRTSSKLAHIRHPELGGLQCAGRRSHHTRHR